MTQNGKREFKRWLQRTNLTEHFSIISLTQHNWSSLLILPAVGSNNYTTRLANAVNLK